MAQLVFVHGVATRSGPELAKAEENRDTLFKRVVFPNTGLQVRSPHWGDLVPQVDRIIFETDTGVESFSLTRAADDGGGLTGGVDTASGGGDAAAVAQANPVTLIDAVFAQVVDRADVAGEPLDDTEIEAFVRAVDAVADESAVRLVGGAMTDAEIALALTPDTHSLSVFNPISAAVSAVTDRFRNAVSTLAFGTVRDTLSPAVAFFLGDVFAYLNTGGVREGIRKRVRDDLLAAHAERAKEEPLIVIGHSLGGVILVDMLCDPTAGLPNDLKIDALFTVGSQPGLFQSLGALTGGVSARDKRERPAAVKMWCNVFDPIDPLAFRANPVFDGVEDVFFDSITGLASAHTTYFKRPQFYARFRKRLEKNGLLQATEGS